MPPRTARLIAERIASQAVQEGSPLSVVECKMLLFSETSPTFPDILEVNEIFDRDYDRNEYETKISNLIGHLRSSDRMNPDANPTWTEAVRSLRGQDYYFMVMLDKAGGRERPRGDFVRLIATAVAIVAVALAIAYFLGRH